MWISFRPVKNREMLISVAEKLMKVKPVRIEKVVGGWMLSIKLNSEIV
ncbi:hypothetical protein [Tepidanaerobacter acetatoxydans]|nr:hypothetical protein [Tepidanaerobacter acetatoxydans]